MTEPAKILLERLIELPPEERRSALIAAGEAHAKAFDGEWAVWAHEGQMPPNEDWTVCVMKCGRGFGKTRAGAEWVSAKARANPGCHIALVAATPDEARRVMVEGRSGLMAVARDGDERRRMRWEPGLKRLTFASGAQAFVYSGADGESLRGPEHHFAWCDELAKWKKAQIAWDNLILGLRAGARPQVMVTTTPRAVPAMRAVLAIPDALVTGGTSFDNPHSAKAFLAAADRQYGGTRLGRQELLGEMIEDVEGSLWPRALLEASRIASPLPREAFRRVVVGVDPPVTAHGDECGIVACGLTGDNIAHVLGDHSAGGLSPEQWARKAAAAVERWQADRIVAEGNQGGEMVESVLRASSLRLPVKRVHATVSKVRRAEPVAAFFETGDARLAGSFPDLEDQLAHLTIGGQYRGPTHSPDRADAMIWAMTELLLGPERPEPRISRL
ncbi:MAG TPA: terminase family protein [Allosphingosinicella sp.]|jgi:phage terminase large subunit-like protein